MPTYKQKRQVRFAYKNTYHSPHTTILPLPSLGLSSQTPVTSSSSGPSAYTITSFPSTSRCRPHPLLESSPLRWDLMENPSTITWNHHLISSQVLYEPATIPSLPFISITSIHLPWAIRVHPSHGSYVTVSDVFDCIYRSLRTNITTNEFDSIPLENDKRRATRAYEQRYRRLRSVSAYDKEKRGGMKRIDFLMGHTQFRGISPGSLSDDWRLNITT